MPNAFCLKLSASEKKKVHLKLKLKKYCTAILTNANNSITILENNLKKFNLIEYNINLIYMFIGG